MNALWIIVCSRVAHLVFSATVQAEQSGDNSPWMHYQAWRESMADDPEVIVAKEPEFSDAPRTVWVNSPSLHMGWDYRSAGLSHANWAYSELEVGPDTPNLRKDTYWATMTTRRGYMGFQHGKENEAQAICSTWDLGDREQGHVPRNTDMEYCGPGVTCKLFGREGTGLQSFVNWRSEYKAGTKFRSMMHMVPYAGNDGSRVKIHCWFQVEDFNHGQWFHMSTYDGPDFPGQVGFRPGAFLENFGWTNLDHIGVPARGIYRMWAKGGHDFGSLDEWVHLTEAKTNACQQAASLTGGLNTVDDGVTTDTDGIPGHFMSHCGCTLKRPRDSDVNGVYDDNVGRSDQRCQRSSHEECATRLNSTCTWQRTAHSPAAEREGLHSFQREILNKITSLTTTPPATISPPSTTAQTSGHWTLISPTAACEANSEGIVRTFGASPFTLASCQSECRNTVGCVAIDFYSETGWCNLFDVACSLPARTRDGASSYRVHQVSTTKMATITKRTATTSTTTKTITSTSTNTQALAGWTLISSNAACEDNEEGVQRIFGDYGFCLTSCQSSCQTTQNCVTIDFYSASGWCNMFDIACKAPGKTRDGASSYRLTKTPTTVTSITSTTSTTSLTSTRVTGGETTCKASQDASQYGGTNEKCRSACQVLPRDQWPCAGRLCACTHDESF